LIWCQRYKLRSDDGSYPDQLKFDEFKGAIEMAINSVVSGSAKDTDYTYSIKSATIDNDKRW
jgi:hypothetical protein